MRQTIQIELRHTFAKGEPVAAKTDLPMPTVKMTIRRLVALRHRVNEIHHVLWLLTAMSWVVLIVLQISVGALFTVLKLVSVGLAIVYVPLALRCWVLSLRVQRDPLSDPDRSVVWYFDRVPSADVGSLSKIRDWWFYDDSDEPASARDRVRYLSALQSANPRVFWGLYELANDRSTHHLIAFSSILPLQPSVSSEHLTGTLNQEQLRPTDLLPIGDDRVSKSPLFLQAIAVHPNRFHDARARALAKTMVAAHIADLLLPSRSRLGTDIRVRLYAESSTKGGAKTLRGLGFKKQTARQGGRQMLFLDDTETPLPPCGEALVSRVRASIQHGTPAGGYFVS